MKSEATKKLTLSVVFVAIYVASTAINPLGYGPLQFRISELLLIIPFFDKRFIPGAIIAVAIANFFSPLGIIDVGIGVSIAVISYTLLIKIYNKYLLIIAYAILCGLIVGAGLHYVYEIPYFFNVGSIALSQLIIGLVSLYVIRQFIKVGVVEENATKKSRFEIKAEEMK